ncbi:unnamed protein product [Rhizophagus irregularis]|nr:unnamed protein product [Rhizophagus irregularis]
MTCSHCGENRIEYDTAAGHAFCPKCGFVVEESKIVSEVTFGESASGAAILQGSYVGADQRRARSAGPYRRHSSLDSREQTIANGRRQIQALATALRLADHLMEAAQRYFNLAITNNFIQDKPYVDRFFGHFTSKCFHFGINIFETKFGEETPKVVADALRLVQRMDRDWMQTGRRPAGICGACLLIAARMNNFQRSIKEVIAVVKTADITIKKRLEEFKVTPTGKLSVQDFRNLWLEQQCDPPAFTRARKAAKIAKDKRHAMAISDSTLNETGENYNQITTGSSNGEIIGSKRKRDLNDVDGDEIQLRQGISDFYEDNSQAKTGESQNDEIAGKKRKRNLTEADKEGPSARIDKGKQPMCDFEAEVDRVLEEEVNSFLGDKYLLKVSTDLEERALQSANSDSEDSKSDADQNEELGSDLDEDDEVKNAILTEDEVKLKTQVWMELNGDYLREMEEKRKQQEIDRQNGIGVRRHKRPRKGRNADQMVASTPAEAARKLFEERNLSKKINFKVLDNLLENLTESIPNTPTSWRDYDPTSISGSGIARSGTPHCNYSWTDGRR